MSTNKSSVITSLSKKKITEVKFKYSDKLHNRVSSNKVTLIRINTVNYQIKDVLPDGNCFFIA